MKDSREYHREFSRKWREDNRKYHREWNRLYRLKHPDQRPDRRPPGYVRNHERVYREFGKAKEYDCFVCENSARTWAYLSGDESRPENYAPLCDRCHYYFDRGGLLW